jgi:hypothetical protein
LIFLNSQLENIMNIHETFGRSLTVVLPEDVRRDLIALRVKHGPLSAIGCRCSNIVELIQLPEVPKFQLERQMADLQRLLHDVQ